MLFKQWQSCSMWATLRTAVPQKRHSGCCWFVSKWLCISCICPSFILLRMTFSLLVSSTLPSLVVRTSVFRARSCVLLMSQSSCHNHQTVSFRYRFTSAGLSGSRMGTYFAACLAPFSAPSLPAIPLCPGPGSSMSFVLSI